MERPYTSQDMDKFMMFINELKDINFPKNKLRKFYDLKMDTQKNNNIEPIFDFVNLAGKLDKNQKKLLKNSWLKDININLDTNDSKINPLDNALQNIFDVIEIYDFVGGKNEN